MELSYSHGDRYCEYIFNGYPDMDASVLARIEAIAASTNWENPTSSLDWNNLAVIDLIEAEQSEDLKIRAIHIRAAMQSLERGLTLDRDPLCAAHYALIQSTIAESDKAMNLAFNYFLRTLQPAYTATASAPSLIYLPPSAVRTSNELELMLQSENRYKQAIMLLSEVLSRSQLVFYNASGVRFLELATQLFPNSPAVHLRLGIATFMQGRAEGLLNLHRARQLDPDNATILQALHLSYANIGDLETANYWLDVARDLTSAQGSSAAAWQWTKVDADSAMTYVSFEQNLAMAVEPRFSSIVTSVLVAEGDWFEREMEFWRHGMQPGMTAIDVGANAGVYTFSAAKRVGPTGMVLAIEPFSKCVNYLQETCRRNQLDWVRVCAGAASDRNGTARLSVNSASELNEIVPADAAGVKTPGNFEEVACFTLDSLIEREGIHRVDFLKIDAEGHEMQVLRGSDRLLTEFAPVILYENIAGAQGSNLPVAKFLTSIGYQLFRYQPYLQKLIPLDREENIGGNLNIIALPQKHIARLTSQN